MAKNRKPIPPIDHAEATLYRRSRAEEAAAYIRELIFSGYLAPGDRVHQTDIAEALHLSRIPVREAIAILEREGRVRTELNRGAFVAPLDERSIRDAADIFSYLYGFVARRAAEQATPEIKVRLKELQKEIQRSDDPIEMRRHMEAHRGLIVEAGASPLVTQWIRGADDLVMDNYYVVLPDHIDKFKERSALMTKAIIDGDADTAEALGLEHEAGIEDAVRYHKERGLLEEARADSEVEH